MRAYKARRRAAVSVLTSGFDFGSTSSPDDPSQVILMEAAEAIAEIARTLAGSFSRRIPAATKVYWTGENAVTIAVDPAIAPNGAPFEFGKNHPLFGDRELWYKTPLRPYMDQAAKTGQAAALEVYSQLADVIAAQNGYVE
jgi:hypothetical protein